MPRGLSSPIKTELAGTTFQLPVYCIRIRRNDGTFLRYAEQQVTFNDGTPSQTYTARLKTISGFDFSADEAGPLTITLANVDGVITGLDHDESFAGGTCELLAYLPGLDTYYIPWAGYCDEVIEMNAEIATLQANPLVTNPHVQLPQRTVGIPCTHVFANTNTWVNAKNFEGSECPYRLTATVGFVALLSGSIGTGDLFFTVDWTAGDHTAGAAFKKGHVIQIDSEKMLIVDFPSFLGDSQDLTVQRGYAGTANVAHSAAAPVLFASCYYDTLDCIRHGMYGNNSADTYSGGTKKRNYFGGFPFITGYQYGNYRSKSAEKAKPLRLVFSGNESAYGRVLPLVYGRVRISDPILLIAKPEGDFLTTLWLVAEGLLATNTTDDAQTTPSDAYIKTSGVENIYVNGVSRHDPRPGFGIEVVNGDQDRGEPAAAFFPAGAGQIDDFINKNLGFWGTARVTFRINTKNNPSVDVQGQSITGSMEIAYGRVVRVYSDTVTFARKAATNPAWVLMDVMTAKRAGGGLDHARLNIQSFLDLASHANENITSTFDGSTVNRWTFNGIVDARQSYAEWVHRIALGCYCLPPFVDKDGKLKVKALKDETLSGLPVFSSKVASTTARNIIWENGHSGLIKRRRPISEIPNEIRVNYVDRSDYAKVSLTVADRDSQIALGTKMGDTSRRAITKSIDLPGTSTLDEAARLATLLLRAGEFGQGGLANNLEVSFPAFYRDAEDLEIGDVIEVEDDQLDAAEGEQYFRVSRISNEPMPMNDGAGFVLTKTIEAVLHSNEMYDDTAFTVSKFDRIDAPNPSDMEPPAVTGFGVTEGGIFDTNNKLMTSLTFTYTEPSPKQNFKSVALHVTDDDGAGNPVEGAWRYIGDLFASGEIIRNFEITNTRRHFCAASRALSGHAADVGTLTAAGAFKYPRASAIIDGVTDVLPAPSGAQIFIGSGLVSLKWNSYTGNDLKLFKSFRVYRNVANDLPTADLIASPDTNIFIDTTVTSSTVYYYWIKGFSILNQEGAATSVLSTTSPSDSGTDTAVPDAPTLGIVRSFSSFNSNEYEWTIGIDKPGGAANWNTVNIAHLQIATDAGFSSLVLDREMSITEKALTTFRVNNAGTYHFRARVKNAFGFSAYSSTLTRTTSIGDATTADTDLIAAPTLTIKKATDSGFSHLAGNQFYLEFDVASAQAESYWGYTLIGHTSSTLPTATTDDTGTAGVINAGANILTDSSKAWTPSAYINKHVVIFSNKRGGSPTWDYEGVIYIAKITANTGTVLTFDLPLNRITHTLTGIKYYVVTPGNHFYEKIAFSAVGVDEGVTSPTDQRAGKRRLLISAATPTMYFWLGLNNLHGAGKVQGSPSSTTFVGLTAAELKNGILTTAKFATDYTPIQKVSSLASLPDGNYPVGMVVYFNTDGKLYRNVANVWTKAVDGTDLIVSSVTADKINVTNLAAIKADLGTVTAGTIIGLLIQTAASGGRIEMDSTNGLRAYSTGGTLITQISISGGDAGRIQTTILDALTDHLFMQSNSGLNSVQVLNSNVIEFYSGPTSAVLRLSIDSSDVYARSRLRSQNGLLVEKSSADRFEVDASDSASQTAMLVRQDGAKRRVKTVFVPADTWGAGLPVGDINVLYVD